MRDGVYEPRRERRRRLGPDPRHQGGADRSRVEPGSPEGTPPYLEHEDALDLWSVDPTDACYPIAPEPQDGPERAIEEPERDGAGPRTPPGSRSAEAERHPQDESATEQEAEAEHEGEARQEGEGEAEGEAEQQSEGEEEGEAEQEAEGEEEAESEGEGGEGEEETESTAEASEEEVAVEPPPPPPPPPRLGGIHERNIPPPPRLDPERRRSFERRTGLLPEAHHAAIRRRLASIGARSRQLQRRIVREAGDRALEITATYMTKAAEIPVYVEDAEARVRASYAGARAMVTRRAEDALAELGTAEGEAEEQVNRAKLTTREMIQRVLDASSPEIRALHEELTGPDSELKTMLDRHRGVYEGHATAAADVLRGYGDDSARSVTTGAGAVKDARREGEEKAWATQANGLADPWEESQKDAIGGQFDDQHEQVSLMVLMLVNPAAVEYDEEGEGAQGEGEDAHEAGRFRLRTDHERAIRSVEMFRDIAVGTLEAGEKGAVKEIRAIGKRLQSNIEVRGATLEQSVQETAGAMAEAYVTHMEGVNGALEADGVMEIARFMPVLEGAEQRVEEIFAMQTAELESTVAGAVESTDAQIEAEMMQAHQIARSSADEAWSTAREQTGLMSESVAAYQQGYDELGNHMGTAGPAYGVQITEHLGKAPDEVRAQVHRLVGETDTAMTTSGTEVQERLLGEVGAQHITETYLHDSLVSAGLAVIQDIDRRCNEALAAMDQVGTDEAKLMTALRRLTETQGRAMKARWPEKTTSSHSLLWWIRDELSGDELSAAEAYLSGDTVAGARYELEASMPWYGDDEERIEAVMRDLDAHLRETEQGTIGDLEGEEWSDTLGDLRSNLGGTDLNVADALIAGNPARATAYRTRDSIEEARRSGDHDAVADILGNIPTEQMADVRREFAIIRGADEDVTPAQATETFTDFVMADREIYVGGGGGAYGGGYGEPQTVTMRISGSNADLVRLLAGRTSDPNDPQHRPDRETRVAIQSARMEVELDRGEPDYARLQQAYEYDRSAELDPDLDSPNDAVRKRAEQRRDAARAERVEAMQQLAGRRGGYEDPTPEQAEAYATSAVVGLFGGDTEGQRFGRTMVEEGWADPATAMHIAMRGAGTDEDLIRRTLSRLTREEIQQLAVDYGDRYADGDSGALERDLGINRQRDTSIGWGDLALTALVPAYGAVALLDSTGMFEGGELSGDERLEAEVLWMGRPRNDRERYEIEMFRIEQHQREQGLLAGAVMGDGEPEAEGADGEQSPLALAASLTMGGGAYLADELFGETTGAGMIRRSSGSLRGMVDEANDGPAGRAFDESGRFLGSHPTRNPQTGEWEPDVEEAWEFQNELQWTPGGVAAYTRQLDSFVNVLTTIVAIVASVICMIAMPGVGGFVAAAIVGGLASMGTKALFKGGRYGWEEAAVDLAVTAADAVTAGLTGGMGQAMRNTAKAGGMAAKGLSFGARRSAGLLAGWAERGTGGKIAAYVVSESVENIAGAFPPALVGQLLNERNYQQGSALGNILGGALMQTGISAGAGLVVSGSRDAFQGARGLLRSRALGRELRASMTPEMRAAFHDVPVRELPAESFRHLVDSDSVRAVTMITPDGPVVYVREGVSPRVLREEGIHLMQTREPHWAQQVGALDEANLARWHEMSLSEQIPLYRAKMELEIDAQRRLIADLEDEIALAGPLQRRALRRRLGEAQRTLRNLETRSFDLEGLTPERVARIDAGEEVRPQYLQERPRLFDKDTGETIRAEVEMERRVLPDEAGHPDRSPLQNRTDIEGTVVEIGPRWVEPNGREYRRVGVLDADGNLTRVRQEIRSAHEDGRWVQRGSESNRSGEVGEVASRHMSAADVRPGYETHAIASQWDGSGRGFDEVLLDFRMEGGELVARVRVVEVKHGPGRYVGLDQFTAIRPPPAGNLEANLRFIDGRLRDVGTLPRSEGGLGLTREQVRAARRALRSRSIDLELRITPGTKIGARERGTVLADLEAEWRTFGISLDQARVREIPPAYMRMGEAEVAQLPRSETTESAPEVEAPQTPTGARGPTEPPMAPGAEVRAVGRDRAVIVEPYIGPGVESTLHLQAENPNAVVIGTEARHPPSQADVARLEAEGAAFLPSNRPSEIPPNSVDAMFMRFPLPHDRAVKQDFIGRLAEVEAHHPGMSRPEQHMRALEETNLGAESASSYGRYALERLRPGGELEVVFWERQILDDLQNVGDLRIIDPETGRGYRLEIETVGRVPKGEVAPHSGWGVPVDEAGLVYRARLRKVRLTSSRPSARWAVAPHSGRPFRPELSGGPIRELDWRKIRVTDRGVEAVERHLARFGGAGELEQAMLARLRAIARGEIPATEYDLRFYSHELRELVRYRKMGWPEGQPSSRVEAWQLWNDVHTATLEDHGLRDGEGIFFHPEVEARHGAGTAEVESPTGARGPPTAPETTLSPAEQRGRELDELFQGDNRTGTGRQRLRGRSNLSDAEWSNANYDQRVNEIWDLETWRSMSLAETERAFQRMNPDLEGDELAERLARVRAAYAQGRRLSPFSGQMVELPRPRTADAPVGFVPPAPRTGGWEYGDLDTTPPEVVDELIETLSRARHLATDDMRVRFDELRARVELETAELGHLSFDTVLRVAQLFDELDRLTLSRNTIVNAAWRDAVERVRLSSPERFDSAMMDAGDLRVARAELEDAETRLAQLRESGSSEAALELARVLQLRHQVAVLGEGIAEVMDDLYKAARANFRDNLRDLVRQVHATLPGRYDLTEQSIRNVFFDPLPSFLELHHFLKRANWPELALDDRNLILALRAAGGAPPELHGLIHALAAAGTGQNKFRGENALLAEILRLMRYHYL